jgi:hypothetical protein
VILAKHFLLDAQCLPIPKARHPDSCRRYRLPRQTGISPPRICEAARRSAPTLPPPRHVMNPKSWRSALQSPDATGTSALQWLLAKHAARLGEMYKDIVVFRAVRPVVQFYNLQRPIPVPLRSECLPVTASYAALSIEMPDEQEVSGCARSALAYRSAAHNVSADPACACNLPPPGSRPWIWVSSPNWL